MKNKTLKCTGWDKIIKVFSTSLGNRPFKINTDEHAVHSQPPDVSLQQSLKILFSPDEN